MLLDASRQVNRLGVGRAGKAGGLGERRMPAVCLWQQPQSRRESYQGKMRKSGVLARLLE